MQAVALQIVLAWFAAVLIVLPGVVGLLPAHVGWSDQYSHCSYDRAESYGALTLIFCAGFIVPYLVMVYCYAMIWCRMRQVGRQVDKYNRAYRQLQVARQQSVHAADDERHSPPASVPAANTQAFVHDTPQNADDTNNRQLLTQGDNMLANVQSTTPDKDAHSDGVMECPQQTDSDCPNRLLAVVTSATVAAQMNHVETSNDDKTPQNTSTTVHWSSAISEHEHAAACSSRSDKINDDAEEQTKPKMTADPKGYLIFSELLAPALDSSLRCLIITE